MTSRLFHLERDVDVSGVSGVGVVAEGVAFSDGTAVIHWIAGEHRSTVVWPELAGVEAIHGHGGATRIVWADGGEDGPTLATVEQLLKQLERDRAVPYWQGEPHGPSLDAAAVWLESLRDHLETAGG